MESFFLPETAKYLYLLNSDAAALPDYYVFSTEGHLLPPFPYPPNIGHSNSSSSNPLNPTCPQSNMGGAQSSGGDDSRTCSDPADSAISSEPSALAIGGGVARVEDLPSTSRQTEATNNAGQPAGLKAVPGNVWNALAQLVTDGIGMGSPEGVPSNCQPMCEERKEKEARKEQRALHRAFPLLKFDSSKSE